MDEGSIPGVTSRGHRLKGSGHFLSLTKPKGTFWAATVPCPPRAPIRAVTAHCPPPPPPSRCWSRQTPARTRRVHLDAPGQRHGATAPSPGRPTPGVVKQDKSSGGSVDTTKTRSGPQRVRMSSGERPIGAATGKQSDTEASCQTPPPVCL